MSVNHFVFAPGEIVVITQGTYSDYAVKGAFRILRGCDFKVLETVWLETSDRPAGRVGGGWNGELAFVHWLKGQGYIEPTDVAREVHIGSDRQFYIDDWVAEN